MRINMQRVNYTAMGIIIAASMFALFAASVPAQEHPAFGAHQVIQLTITADVPDIPKLEARAVDILRRWDPSLTLAGARAKVRVDGKTDVARCLEYITVYQLQQVSQARITGIRQEAQHPEPTGAQ